MYEPIYPKVDRRVVRAIREFLDTKPYRGDHGARVTAVNTLAARCAQAYRIPTPRVTIEPHAVPTGSLGRYDDDCNTIVLAKFSLAGTLYHIARLNGKTDKQAKAWTASAIHLARPKTLRNMVRKGTLRWRVARTAISS